MPNCRPYFVILLLLVCIQTFGCSGCQQSSGQRDADNKELQQLGNQFMEFYRAQNKTPADENELKEFIAANMTDVKREILGITDVNKLFVSPRDGKPFVIRYGMEISRAPPASGSDAPLNGDVVAYEAVGQGGYRHVFSSLGELTELKFEDLVKLVPDAK